MNTTNYNSLDEVRQVLTKIIDLKPNGAVLENEPKKGGEKASSSLTIEIPIKTISEGNCFEPWQVRHKRHKAQKKAVFVYMLPMKHLLKLPCVITLVRLASRFLDVGDNLPMSLKYIRDGVAEQITGDYVPGRADNNTGLTWKYDQEKSKKYGVKIIFEF